jgi:hypothetical protein
MARRSFFEGPEDQPLPEMTPKRRSAGGLSMAVKRSVAAANLYSTMVSPTPWY